MVRNYYIETFGCQMNEHDSEKISGLLSQRGMIPVTSPAEADLFILNTCSVREKAATKVYSRLGEVRSLKKKDPRFLIGVVGCVAQQEGQEMAHKAPFIDLVVGTHQYHAIPDLLDQLEAAPGGAVRVETSFSEAPSPVEIQATRRNRFRAALTIMEGCNKRCSFCIVPFTRGRERNRPASAILQEARRAVDQGYVEILLLGQTVNSYRDPQNPRFKFARLLASLAEIPGLRRLRFTSPHPRDFDDECISVIAHYSNIATQVHLPLQSGSDRLLRRMRRQYDQSRYLQLVEKFRNCGRPISFSTDVIVGFPGETERDFEQTLYVASEVQFEAMFSFKYSPRPQTEADPWEDDVSEPEKTRRLSELNKFQKSIQFRLHEERYLNRDFEVLVEGIARDGLQRFGRTLSNKVANFPGDDPPGTFRQVTIRRVGPNSLNGALVTTADTNN